MWNTARIGIFMGPQEVRSFDLRLRHPLARGTDLASVLAPLRGSQARLEVVLSDAHCRYLVVPRPEGIRNRDELSAALLSRFQSAFGDGDGWQLRHDAAPFDTHDVVCGIDEASLHTLQSQADASGLTLHTIRPHWVAWARHFARQTRRGHHWLIAADDGWASIGYLVNGRCTQVRALRLPAGARRLDDLLARERAFVEGSDPNAAVWVAGNGFPAPATTTGTALTSAHAEALWGAPEAA